MGKLIPVLVAGGGTTVVSVGGFYLVNKNGSSQVDGATEISEGGDRDPQGLGSSVGTDNDDPEVYGLSDFESGKGGICAQYVFGNGLDFAEDGSPLGSDNQINYDFSSNASGEVKSCFVVSWEKTNYSDTNSNKWKGYFRWVWSFSAGDKGLVMFLATKENSLDLEGSFYYLEQESGPSSAWVIKEKKKVDDGKSITNDFGSTFPTVGTSISNLLSGDSQSNWGFVTGENDISNFCGDGNTCGALNTSSTKSFKESFLWQKEDSGSPITNWMGNFDALFKAVFNGENLHLENFKGSWTKSTIPSS